MSEKNESLHSEIHQLKNDIAFIKSMVSEDFELSSHAKKMLKEARETPESEYVDLE